jgi:hypothetical protein
MGLWQTEHLIGKYRQSEIHPLLRSTLRSTPARGEKKAHVKVDHGLLAQVLIQDNSMRFSDADLI